MKCKVLNSKKCFSFVRLDKTNYEPTDYECIQCLVNTHNKEMAELKRKRNCQIADLKNKVKEGKKTITTCELVLSEFVSREEFERIKKEVIYK